jgi:hypothetical protein
MKNAAMFPPDVKIFPPDVLPQRNGVYRTCTVDVETGEEAEAWGYSYFDTTDRVWGCTQDNIEDAVKFPEYEFAHQYKRWAWAELPTEIKP